MNLFPKKIHEFPQKQVLDLVLDQVLDLVLDLVLVQDLALDFLYESKYVDLKWVHMARYGLIVALDEAICIWIISNTLPIRENHTERPKIQK